MVIAGKNIYDWTSKFNEHQISIILEFILKSWETYQVPSDKEDKITRSFSKHLQNQKNRSLHNFLVLHQIELSDIEGNIIGRIDLMFFKGTDEDVYFSFECKRLRVNFPSGFQTLADKYVTDGMSRYFKGQYASGLDKGGMLGYVMDGQTEKAIQDVEKAICDRRALLNMGENESFRRSSAIVSKQVKETHHNYGPKGEFVLYHIFLPLNT